MAAAAVNLKFVCLLLLVQVLFSFNAHAHEALQDDAVSTHEEEEVMDIGGRISFESKVIIKRAEIEGINGALEENSKFVSTASNQIMVEKGKRMKKQKVVGNGGFSKRSNIGHSNDKEMNKKSGFVAFSADYHSPRHHPPKNN